MAPENESGTPAGSGDSMDVHAVPGRPALIPAEDAIFDKRSLLIGLAVSALIAMAAFSYRFAVQPGTAKLPQPFEFTVAEPQVEEFKLREVQRDILQERREEVGARFSERDERPDLHFTTDPRETAPHAQEVIQSGNVTVDTARIEVGGTEVSIDMGPAEISQVTTTTQYALTPIAVDVGGAAADFIKYKDPAPRDRPATYFMNTAPRPGRNLRSLPRAFGDQNAPGSGQLGPLNINLNGTGEFFHVASKFGDVKAKTSVDGALHWLAIHQEPDGLWYAEKYGGEKNCSLAVTGLACLAFMGAGNTANRGEYSRNVRKGIEALLRNQAPDGALIGAGKSATSHVMYTHCINTIAVCEAYGRARDEKLMAAAQRAVTYLEKGVNPDGGWRYKPRYDSSDMSVTAWAMQALKTAKLAQLKFNSSVFSRGLVYLDGLTDKGAGADSSGAVGYEQAEGGRGRPALTCAGQLVRQFNGMGVKNPLLVGAAELTRRDPPDWRNKDFYYWYYATYAMHNMGGEYRLWWNKRIRDVLFENQIRSGEHAGSWDPLNDRWAHNNGSRVYTTALGALCLEVYYRYSEALTSFGSAPDLDELFFQP